MREMVRPTSAADINSLPVAASPAAPMRDLDLLLRLSGRIVKGCRLPGSVAFRAAPAKMTGATSPSNSSRFRFSILIGVWVRGDVLEVGPVDPQCAVATTPTVATCYGTHSGTYSWW